MNQTLPIGILFLVGILIGDAKDLDGVGDIMHYLSIWVLFQWIAPPSHDIDVLIPVMVMIVPLQTFA